MNADPTHPFADPNHPLHDIYLRSLKVSEDVKHEPFQLPAGATIEVAPKRSELPSVYSHYAEQLTAAIDYLVKNNTGLAKVPTANLGVTPQHLRNILREVRNSMRPNPPHKYPLDNLTFTAVSDGVVVRDKTKEKEAFKITTPVSSLRKLDDYPIVASAELIAALAVVLAAKHEGGNAVEWPNFVLYVPDPGDEAQYREDVKRLKSLMRQSFPSNWEVGPPDMDDIYITVQRRA